ncbi:MAG: hypothetical protein OHK0046_13740 [Anaerolineae bacterium]
MSNDTAREKISRLQTQVADEMMQKANVVGLAIGKKQTGGQTTDEMALVVLVEKKMPLAQLAPHDVIPPEIDGVPVDVREVGFLAAQ